MKDQLSEPKSEAARLARRLAQIAMSVTHHDISDSEPEAIHEIQAMERRFLPLIKAYSRRKSKATTPVAEPQEER